MKEIAILIPCLNEEKTIEKVILDCKKNLPNTKIYVFDNNSTDDTAEIAKKAGAIVCFEKRKGKGYVMRKMFEIINADCYLLLDGDDSADLKDAKKMVNFVIENDVDMVIGDRLSGGYFNENKRKFHNFGNSLIRYIINKIFKSNIQDILSGYRAFSRRFVKTFPAISQNFEIETEMTIHAIFADMKIENITTKYKDRPKGSVSKLNTFKDGFKILKTILILFKNYKPLKFFSCISAFLVVATAIIFIPTIWIPYVKTKLVKKIPTLICCGFMFTTAIISFFSGLILDTIVQNQKKNLRLKIINETTKNEK